MKRCISVNERNSKPVVHSHTDKSIQWWSKNVCNEGHPDKEFHLYGMDWTPDGIKFYYDNKLIGEAPTAPRYKMCMIISMYTSNLKQLPPAAAWTGINKGVYPKTAYIDYIRVWKSNEGYVEE